MTRSTCINTVEGEGETCECPWRDQIRETALLSRKAAIGSPIGVEGRYPSPMIRDITMPKRSRRFKLTPCLSHSKCHL